MRFVQFLFFRRDLERNLKNVIGDLNARTSVKAMNFKFD